MKNNDISNILTNDIEIIKQISNFLLQVVNPENVDFQFCIKKINKLENDTLFIKNIRNIDLLSNIKKIFLTIDRNKLTFYEFKYNLFSVLSKLELLYVSYLKIGIDNIENESLENELNEFDKSFSDDLKLRNINKVYYYIKITLDTNISYFYLSRKNVLLHLKEYGKPYNYTPYELDDDSCNYFIFDYKADKNVNVNEILQNLKQNDDAIIDFSVFQVNSENNIYNIKFFIDDDTNKHSCILLNKLEFIDLLHYSDFYDAYIEAKNRRHIIDKLMKFNAKHVDLILLKKISDREVKVFLPNGLNKNNIEKIKKIFEYILIDKTVTDILYFGNIDFYGLQMLKYLGKRYNTEFSDLNN